MSCYVSFYATKNEIADDNYESIENDLCLFSYNERTECGKIMSRRFTFDKVEPVTAVMLIDIMSEIKQDCLAPAEKELSNIKSLTIASYEVFTDVMSNMSQLEEDIKCFEYVINSLDMLIEMINYNSDFKFYCIVG